jgi:hypothetical protein
MVVPAACLPAGLARGHGPVLPTGKEQNFGETLPAVVSFRSRVPALELTPTQRFAQKIAEPIQNKLMPSDANKNHRSLRHDEQPSAHQHIRPHPLPMRPVKNPAMRFQTRTRRIAAEAPARSRTSRSQRRLPRQAEQTTSPFTPRSKRPESGSPPSAPPVLRGYDGWPQLRDR